MNVQGALAGVPAPDGKAHRFGVEGGQFVLDGKPFRVVSGEMHYPRIPRGMAARG